MTDPKDVPIIPFNYPVGPLSHEFEITVTFDPWADPTPAEIAYPGNDETPADELTILGFPVTFTPDIDLKSDEPIVFGPPLITPEELADD